MFKKMISFVLATSIVTSIFLVPAAAYEQQNTEPETKITTMVDDGIAYTMVEDENGRSVSYTKDGVFHEARYDFNTGVLSYDNKCIAVVQTETEVDPQMVGSGVAPFATKYTWKLYNTSYGDLKSDVETVDAWVSVISVLTGTYNVKSLVTDIAKSVVMNHLPTIYYVEKQYYKDLVETSRPQTAHCWDFYKDANHKQLIGTIDARPKV